MCHQLSVYLLSGILIVILILNGGEWVDSRAGDLTPRGGGGNTRYLSDRRMASPRTVLSTGTASELS